MTTTPAQVHLADYRAPDFRIPSVDLSISLSRESATIVSRLEMEPAGTTNTLVLDGDELELVSVTLDGELLPEGRYKATPQQLTITNTPSSAFSLEIVTRVNPTANTKLMGLYRSGSAYCTQCEAEGFRRITYFLDRPDVLAVYTTRIEADKAEAPVLLGNGNLIESGDLSGGRHFAVWHDPFPKPSYLFAMVAGDLGALRDSFTTMSGREVALAIYCEHGNETRCRWAMDSLKRSMKWDEDTFGLEYDLDVFNIVAVSDFNMGAMENKGLNVFNDKYILADPDTETDVDYDRIEGVVGHEYFHNWTGNRITCRDWFQLCLKEGLTVFRDQEFTADVRSRPVKRIADVRTLQARQFPEDGGPLAHPVRPESYSEINNFYTPTIYEKGAELVRMLKTIVGAEGFRKGMDLYIERHDGQAVTIEDFLAAFADATGTDLSQFHLWYSQAGTPQVDASGVYDAEARTYALTLRQTTPPTPGQPEKKPMHIPVRFGLAGPNGEDMTTGAVTGGKVEGDVLHLTEAEQTFVFHDVANKPVPSLLREFSAPVRLSIDLTPEELLFLLRTDSDPFNRWQAAQTLALRALIAGTAARKTGGPASIDSAFIDALADTAANPALEAAFRAQVLHLPSEADIAREIGNDIDPDAIAAARREIRKAISVHAAPRLREIFDSLSKPSPFSPDADSAGRRALANAALDLLVAGGTQEAIDLAVSRFHNADNMTDRSAALATLVLNGAPERTAALAAFHDRYSNDALVLDKWLALEASAPSPETLDNIRRLLDHPSFSINNPNRVRSLVGTFAAANATQFNRADGAGYDFVADFLIELDKRNPQTAARILVSFRAWRSLEPQRKAAAERALKRIAEVANLSTDTRDIITRTLAAE